MSAPAARHGQSPFEVWSHRSIRRLRLRWRPHASGWRISRCVTWPALVL